MGCSGREYRVRETLQDASLQGDNWSEWNNNLWDGRQIYDEVRCVINIRIIKYRDIVERRLQRMVGCLLRRLDVMMGRLLGMERLWRPV